MRLVNFATAMIIGFGYFPVGLAEDIKLNKRFGKPGFQKFDSKQFEESVSKENNVTKLYDFFVRTLNRGNIHSKLETMNKEQEVETKTTYNYLFPHVDFAAERQNTKVNNGVRDESANAAVAELFASVGFLKKITESLTVSFDLFAAFRDEPKTQESTVPGQPRRSAESKLVQHQVPSTNSAPIGPIVANENHSYESTKRFKWSDAGKFRGGLEPKIDKNMAGTDENQDDTRFNMYLGQRDELYRANLPVAKKTDTKKLTHTLAIPVFGGVRLGREFSYKGDANSTSVLNIFNANGPTTVNLHYRHLDQKYASELVYTRGSEELRFESATPSSSAPDSSFKMEQTEYKMSYGLLL